LPDRRKKIFFIGRSKSTGKLWASVPSASIKMRRNCSTSAAQIFYLPYEKQRRAMLAAAEIRAARHTQFAGPAPLARPLFWTCSNGAS
jgi:hypothetical protein